MKCLVTTFLALFIVFNHLSYGQFSAAPVSVSQQVVIRNGATFYLHKVEPNQTIFSICKTYGIDSKTLSEDNPELVSGLKAGQTLYIRKAGPLENYTLHTVRWYENLTSIAKKYNVTEESIAKLNSLEDNLIKVRQILKIPKTASTGSVSEVIHETAVKDTVVKKEVVAIPVEPEKKDTFPVYKSPSSGIFNVSLVLPIGSKTAEQDGNNNYLDFYQGFLLALEDMKNEGINLNLKVFDLSDYSSSGTILAQTGKLDESDLIIGPISKKEIEPVVNYASEKSIPIVSPIDTQTEPLLEDHPSFFQVSSNLYYQQVELLKNISATDNVTLIYESNNSESSLVDMTKKILSKKGVVFSSFWYNVVNGKSASYQIAGKLSKTSMNNVIVLSNSEAFVSDALRNLNLLMTKNGYNITVYGMPKWRSFDVIDIAYFHSLNLHLSLQYYIDYNSENVKDFLARYRALYGTEPSAYAFQAYDVAYYFLSALHSYGKDFPENIEGYQKDLLQNDLRFIREKEGSGFINNTARQVIFNPDYSIDVIRLSR